MNEATQYIAKAKRADVVFQEHGIATVDLQYDYGSSSQGLGSFAFGLESAKYEDDVWLTHQAFGFRLIEGLMRAHNVRRFSQIVGRTVLVEATWTEILKITPLPTEGGVELDLTAFRTEWLDHIMEKEEGA